MVGFSISPKVLSFIKQVAPFAGAALSLVPGGVLPAAAIAAIASAIDVKPDEKPEITIQRISSKVLDVVEGKDPTMSPQMLEARLASVDPDVLRIQMEERIALATLDNANTADARKTFAPSNDYTQKIVGVLILLGFLAAVGFILSGRVNLSDPNWLVLVGTVIGYLSAKSDQVVNYYFGSSQGSKRNADTLRNELAKKP